MSKIIAVVATGGTIACTTDDTGALVPTVSAAELVEAAREISTPSDVDISAIDSVRLDSSSLLLTDLDDLLQRVHAFLADYSIAGVVFTNGTESLEDTAMAFYLFNI